jgi:hypothetical protein
MSNRSAQRWFAAAILAAGVTTAGAGVAHADTTANTRPAYISPPGDHGDGHRYHHFHPNCNNDPDSEYAMDPDVCPPSHNGPGY